MKARRVCLYAFAFSLLVCGSACGLSPAEAEQAGEPVVNFGLVDVDKVYVRVIADTVTAIDREQLQADISRRLTENGLQVVPADVSGLDGGQKQRIKELMEEQGPAAKNLRIYSAKVPELIVRVSVLQGEQAGPCVYHVQTSFAREVYLRKPRTSMKAEIWRIDVPIGIADASECEKAIVTGVLGQVDAFVADWKKANTYRVTIDSHEPENHSMELTAQKPGEQGQQKIRYEYVASKNSKVFHKKGCRAAARISSSNLIGFSSRDEAVNSGRRPCKICNP